MGIMIASKVVVTLVGAIDLVFSAIDR